MSTDWKMQYLDSEACRILARYLGDLYYLQEDPEVSVAIETLEKTDGGYFCDLFPSISDKLSRILVLAITDYIACTTDADYGGSLLMDYRIWTKSSNGGAM